MRSGLYYPHTHIRSEEMLRTALLLWDNITIIAPWVGFSPEYSDSRFQEAFEVVGRCHFPTREEKQSVHDLIEDFASRRLPNAFYYQERYGWNREPIVFPDKFTTDEEYGGSDRKGMHCKFHDLNDCTWEYDIFVSKLLPETWTVLREARLASEEKPDGDVCTRSVTGLAIMSLLADCCAGDVFARVTDRVAAYGAISNLFTSPSDSGQTIGCDENQLITVALAAINLDGVPLQKLIDFRKQEESAAGGHFIRDLRHQLLSKLEGQALRLAQLKTQGDRKQVQREFEFDMRDDLMALRDALRLEAFQIIGWKELGTAALATGALATLATVHPLPNLGSSAAIGAIGGLLATGAKFVQTRQKILQEHPMAYVYELSGGLRL
jgi:hypothetical protein